MSFVGQLLEFKQTEILRSVFVAGFFVYTFTKTTNWIEFHQVKLDVLLKISDIIARHGAEIAYPTSTVHIPEAILLQQQ